MCRIKRNLLRRTKKLESPSQQVIENTEEDIFKKYNNSFYEYYCNYLFPQAIEYGMSAEEFWKDDPQLFVSYRTSFINKKKREAEETDYKSWLTGLYIHHGNGILFSSLKQFIGNIVSSLSKGGSKDMTELPKYPRKPYCELEKEERRKQDNIAKEQNYKKYENDLMYYGTLKQQYLNKLSNKEGE